MIFNKLWRHKSSKAGFLPGNKSFFYIYKKLQSQKGKIIFKEKGRLKKTRQTKV